MNLKCINYSLRVVGVYLDRRVWISKRNLFSFSVEAVQLSRDPLDNATGYRLAPIIKLTAFSVNALNVEFAFVAHTMFMYELQFKSSWDLYLLSLQVLIVFS